MKTGKYYYIIVGNRLGSVDVVVPIVLDLKMRAPNSRVTFVFMEDRAYEQWKRDSFLYETLSIKTDSLVRVRWRKSGYLSKLASIWRLGNVVLSIVFSIKPVILHCRGGHSWYMKALFELVRLKRGMTWEYPLQSVPIFPLKRDDSVFSGDEGDGFLCFSEKDVPILRESGRTKLYPIGYPRMYKSWLSYVDRMASSYLERELNFSGAQETVAVFLGSTVEGIFGMGEQREWIRVVVGALRRSMPNALILLKPHPMANPVVTNDMVLSLDDDRVRITYIHVAVLSALAKFVVSRHSSTIVDGLAAGRVVIMYQIFTPAWMKVHPEKSIYPDLGALLTESEDELEQVIASVLDGTFQSPSVAELLGHKENLQPLME